MKLNVKSLQNFPGTKILLYSFFLLLVLLIGLKYVEYRKLKQVQTELNELINNSVRRQQILTSVLKGSDFIRVNFLSILLYPDKESMISAENLIKEQMLKNDKAHKEYKELIGGPEEKRLQDSILIFQKLNREMRGKVIQLVKSGRIQEAIYTDQNNLKPLYESLQLANITMEAFVSKRDMIQIKQAQIQLSEIEQLSNWTDVPSIILLTGMGIIITLSVNLLLKKTQLLEESERKYRFFNERTNEIIEECDAEGNIIFANESFKKKLEYNDEDLRNLLHQDILEDPSQNLNRPLGEANDVITNVEKIFISKSGRKIYLEGNILLEYEGKKFTGSTAFFNDVTEKKQLEKSLIASESKFRTLFDIAPIPMCVFDSKSFKFLQVNKAAVNNYGYSLSEFYSKTIFDIRLEKDVAVAKEDILNWIEELNSSPRYNKINRFRSRHLTKSNEIIEVEVFLTPILLKNKKEILSIGFDITERIHNEQRINKAIINAQEQERYEIGGELHDNVCQILAAAKMSLSVIKSSLPPSASQVYESTREFIVLATNEIRNLSHRLAPAFFESTNLEIVFEKLISTFNVENKYRFYLSFDEEINDLSLQPDVKLNLYRMLQEQLKNIFKYANGSRIEVDVILHNQNLTMRIADNGNGFNVKDVRSGIGLANLKRRAEIFSGNIEIVSSPGNGCEVMVILPVQEITIK